MVRNETKPVRGELKRKYEWKYHCRRFHLPLREWGMGCNQKEHHCQLIILFERCSTSSRFVNLCRVICMIKIICKIRKRMPTLVDSCRKCTKSSSFLFGCWHLLSLQSCNGCSPMCFEREEAKEMLGNQLSCLHLLAILLEEQQECW
jgi:hypothetical protein